MSEETDKATPRLEATTHGGDAVVLCDVHIIAEVSDMDGNRDSQEAKDWAARIVRAVNSHDALVEACEKATNKLAESTGLVGVPMYAKCRKDYEADMLDIIREARAALALAGKVTP